MLLYCVVIEIQIHHASCKETSEHFSLEITLSPWAEGGQHHLQRYFMPLAAEDRRCHPGESCHEASVDSRLVASFYIQIQHF